MKFSEQINLLQLWRLNFKKPFDADVILNGPYKHLPMNMFVFHSVWYKSNDLL